VTSPFAAAGAAALALAAGALMCGAVMPAGSPAGVDRATAASREVVTPRDAGVARRLAPTYAPPVDVPVTVVRAFEPPPAPWAAGHRGVDLAASDGAPVLAPGDGTVTFTGPVAGRPVVVVSHADGLRSSLEPVVGSLPVGAVVSRGQVVGTLSGATTHCAPRRCVHWGVRDGETYLDPMSLLPVHGPVVLLPLDE